MFSLLDLTGPSLLCPVIPEVLVLAGAPVNHLRTVSPVLKLASAGLEGSDRPSLVLSHVPGV